MVWICGDWQMSNGRTAQFISAAQVPAANIHMPVPPMFDMHMLASGVMRKRRPRGIGDRNGGEKSRVNDRLNGFVAKESFIWNELSRRFGSDLHHGELLSIAVVISDFSQIFLDRDAKRRKTVLIKWFQENWSSIAPFLSFVVLEDASGDTLSPREM